MDLKEKINKNLRDALKGGRELEVSTLRMILAAILNKEKEKRAKLTKGREKIKAEEIEKESQLSDEEATEVISSEAKKRKEAIAEFEKGKRQELAEKEKRELEILKNYLPEQFSEEKIKELAKEVIGQIGASSIKDMGKTMAKLMPKLKGRAEGGLTNKIVKELLS